MPSLPSRTERAQADGRHRRAFLGGGRLLLLLVVLAFAAYTLQASIQAAPGTAPRRLNLVAEVPSPSDRQTAIPVEVYIPKGVSPGVPRTVLLALHGIGGSGDSAHELFEAADEHGWVVVAPTFVYDSWLDVRELTDDDTKAIAAIRVILARLPAETSLHYNERVLIYGFSRGAQVAHRFALLYPEQVQSVAALSAGAYTLPTALSPNPDDPALLDWPLGIADFATVAGHEFRPDLVRQVRFFVGVGTRDNRERDVPRDWDSCSGTNRVVRATAFAEALDKLGAPVQLVQFPNAAHRETPEMRLQAIEYLAAAERPRG